MANATPSRYGQVNASGDSLALFYKKAMPEIMATFQELNVMMPLHYVRTITSGKSASFPALGTATASYHVPGTELNGSNAVKHSERIISIDGVLLADVFVAQIDELMSDYEFRSKYTTELGRALANKADKQLLQVAVLTARASATITGGKSGQSVVDASAATVGANLASALFSAAQKLDENDVPPTDRFAVLRPAQYYLLAQTTAVIDKDWGGAGSYAKGKVYEIADITILKSNHVPSTNITAEDANMIPGNVYMGNFTNTVCPVFQREAFGTVKLMDLAFESEYQIQRQGWLMVAKYAMGHGILRPECAVEIKTA